MQEKRKGLTNRAVEAQVALLVTVDDKIDQLDIVWASFSFYQGHTAYHAVTSYCPLTHDYSIDKAIDKAGKKTEHHKINEVDVRMIKKLGVASPRKAEPILKWITK
jgi:hypothetical protein